MTLRKVTLTLDEAWFDALQKVFSPELVERGEVCRWEKVVDLEIDPCLDCKKADMDEYACYDNRGYCLDCCHCEEHEGESWRD